MLITVEHHLLTFLQDVDESSLPGPRAVAGRRCRRRGRHRAAPPQKTLNPPGTATPMRPRPFLLLAGVMSGKPRGALVTLHFVAEFLQRHSGVGANTHVIIPKRLDERLHSTCVANLTQ